MGILRTLLAISVVISHTESLFGFRFVGGMMAVQVFFIISGFYMTMILSQKYVGEGSYRLFITNRFYRLFPIFWAVLIVTLLVSLFWYLLSNDWGKLSIYVERINVMDWSTLFLLILTNIVLFFQDWVMFIGMSTQTGEVFFTNNFIESDPDFYKFLLVPQAWTLGIELTFYLIAPFIVRKSASVIVSFIFLSFLTRAFIYFYLGFTYDPWTYRFFPTELAFFLMGAIAYKIYLYNKEKNLLTENKQKIIIVLFFVILIFYQIMPSPSSGFLGQLAMFSFYLFSFITIPFLFQLSNSSKIDNRIGELSYPIYVSHILMVFILTPIISKFELESYLGELTVLLTIFVSYLLVKTVSDPIENIRRNRVQRFKNGKGVAPSTA